MNDKYIIKNCTACEFSDWEECTGYLAEGYICNDIHTKIVECQDCTDCIMKQIVEKCMEDWEDMATGRFQRELLDLLDIQEVE